MNRWHDWIRSLRYRLLMLALIPALALAAGAAEEREEPIEDPETSVPVEDPPTAAADTAEQPRKDGGPGVFIPTEEISEDFAVSFPVDI